MRKPGDWIHGKYQVQRVLGAGGMGTVYATTRRNESRAAVKVLHPRFARDKAIRARFVEEGYLANRVGHPAVVTILEDDIDEEGNFYLVMELLDGVDLGRFVGPPRSNVTTAQALQIADQLLVALEEAHKKGIVHRDIKPANVMILRDGRIKLLDFGIAKALGADPTLEDDEDEEENEDEDHDDDDAPEESVEHRHLALGTDKYMSPEQGKGFLEAIDARTDLWSVGAMLLSLLANEEPSAAPLWDQSYEERAWAFSRLGKDVPPHVVQIISLALQPLKAKRWASARAMREAVRAAHIDLFGPFKREALAELAAAHLNAHPDQPPAAEALADTSPSESVAPTDPTSVSRGTPPPSVASSKAQDETRRSQFSVLSASTRSRTGIALAFVFALAAVGLLWILIPTSPAKDEAPSIDPEVSKVDEKVTSPQEHTEDDAPTVAEDRKTSPPTEETSLPDESVQPKAPARPVKVKPQPRQKNDSPASGGAASDSGSAPLPDAGPDKRCDGLEGIFAIENCR